MINKLQPSQTAGKDESKVIFFAARVAKTWFGICPRIEIQKSRYGSDSRGSALVQSVTHDTFILGNLIFLLGLNSCCDLKKIRVCFDKFTFYNEAIYTLSFSGLLFNTIAFILYSAVHFFFSHAYRSLDLAP